MSETQNTYTPEYREETAEYVISTGRPAAEVARELNLNEKTVARWVCDYRRRKDREAGRTVADAADPELRAAQKRIRELEMENEFLKKAAAFFARSQA